MAAENSNTQHHFLLPYSLLAALEGVGAVVLLLSQPSMERNAWLFGFSKERILLGGGAMLIILALLAVAMLAFLNTALCEKTSAFLDKHLANAEAQAILITTLVYLLLLIGFCIVLFNTPFARNLGALAAIYQRAAAMLIWAALVLIQTGIFLRIRYGEYFRLPHSQTHRILKTLLALVMATLAFVHIIILALRLDLLISTPGWFWQFHEKEFGPRDLILLLLFFAPLAAALWLYRHPDRKKSGVLLLISLGLFLQYGFGMADEFGIDSVRRKYSESGHKVLCSTCLR